MAAAAPFVAPAVVASVPVQIIPRPGFPAPWWDAPIANPKPLTLSMLNQAYVDYTVMPCIKISRAEVEKRWPSREARI